MKPVRSEEQGGDGELFLGEAVPSAVKLPDELREFWELQAPALRHLKEATRPDFVFETEDGKLVVLEVKASHRAANEIRHARKLGTTGKKTSAKSKARAAKATSKSSSRAKRKS